LSVISFSAIRAIVGSDQGIAGSTAGRAGGTLGP
jgi:hypothetical protein